MDIKWISLTKVLEELGDYFIQQARDNLQENGSIASGDLFNSFEKIVEIEDDFYSVKISLEDYWKYVENGRGAGKFPPIDKIRTWIQIKPITALPDINGRTPSVEQLTFLISRKIAQEGTKAKPFFETAKQEAIEHFENAINMAIEEDVDRYVSEQVEELLNKTFQDF